jgi:hypothetical protein
LCHFYIHPLCSLSALPLCSTPFTVLLTTAQVFIPVRWQTVLDSGPHDQLLLVNIRYFNPSDMSIASNELCKRPGNEEFQRNTGPHSMIFSYYPWIRKWSSAAHGQRQDLPSVARASCRYKLPRRLWGRALVEEATVIAGVSGGIDSWIYGQERTWALHGRHKNRFRDLVSHHGSGASRVK